MIGNILSWLLGSKPKSSGDIAKNRMKLMVIHDRYELPASTVEDLRRDLLDVAAKYFEIDSESAECVIKSQGQRGAFISAVVPLLKRGTNNGNQGNKQTRTSKSNRKPLSTANS